MKPQNVEPEVTSGKKEQGTPCDNHPDREAVHTTDGKAFQVLHLCAECVPPQWPKDNE